MDLADITPLVLTYNEAANIEACLACLAWARDVVVVDSFSTDDTVERARQFANVRVLQRRFDTHSAQVEFRTPRNGNRHAVGPVARCRLSADARIARRDSLARAAYRRVCLLCAVHLLCVWPPAARAACIGRWPRCFVASELDYVQDGHTQRLRLHSGSFGQLTGRMLHDDRKSLGRWLASQDRYMELEARLLLERPAGQLGWTDRLRKWVVLAPWLMFVYCLLVKGALLDGRAGWYYAFQRLTAELILSLKLIEARLRPRAAIAAEQRCHTIARNRDNLPGLSHTILPGDGE